MPTKAPIADSYVVPGSRLVAGEYPGSAPGTPVEKVNAKLEAFLEAGISTFIDLTDPDDGLEVYAPTVQALAAKRSVDVRYEQLTIRDMRVCDAPHMRRVLDAIDNDIANGRTVYVHCWGGIGRTGMVVGCWLVRHGMSGEEALAEVGRLFRLMSPSKVRSHQQWGSPQTEAQRAFVRGWAKQDAV
jgi:protein-tyrosine phosphatase